MEKKQFFKTSIDFSTSILLENMIVLP